MVDFPHRTVCLQGYHDHEECYSVRLQMAHLGNMTTFVRSYVQFVDQHDVPNRSQGMQLIPGTMKWERVKTNYFSQKTVEPNN